MIYSERISDELRTFGPQMSSSVPECRDSLINLSTILLSRDQAWNLQVCILLDFTNRALDIQSWWQWLGLLMSVSGDQILQSVNWKYGTWISTRKHKCSWISTSTLTTSLAGFKQSYYIVLSILSFLHRFYPIPLWHFLPKKGNQMQSVYSVTFLQSPFDGLAPPSWQSPVQDRPSQPGWGWQPLGSTWEESIVRLYKRIYQGAKHVSAWDGSCGNSPHTYLLEWVAWTLVHTSIYILSNHAGPKT